jgi:hypothetical protein
VATYADVLRGDLLEWLEVRGKRREVGLRPGTTLPGMSKLAEAVCEKAITFSVTGTVSDLPA